MGPNEPALHGKCARAQSQVVEMDRAFVWSECWEGNEPSRAAESRPGERSPSHPHAVYILPARLMRKFVWAIQTYKAQSGSISCESIPASTPPHTHVADFNKSGMHFGPQRLNLPVGARAEALICVVSGASSFIGLLEKARLAFPDSLILSWMRLIYGNIAISSKRASKITTYF